MCSKNHGGIVLVRARLFACLQDQPERWGENHLMAGNSDLHRRLAGLGTRKILESLRGGRRNGGVDKKGIRLMEARVLRARQQAAWSMAAGND